MLQLGAKEVRAKELRKLPFITNTKLAGRQLILPPYYDTAVGEWYVYVTQENGTFQRLAGATPVSGIYLASAPAAPQSDYEFFLGTFVIQHLSFARIIPRFFQVVHAVHQFAASLRRYHVISRLSEPSPTGVYFLLEGELTFLTLAIRRYYDLLQKLSLEAAVLVKTADDFSKRVLPNLPQSFADMVLNGDQLRSAADIASKWRLPQPIADFYVSEGVHFQRVRDIRVAIEHHGKPAALVMQLPDGLVLSLSSSPWSDFPIWDDNTRRPNDLGSARALFAFLISNALDLPTRFVRAYWSCVATPPAIAKGLTCYLRNPYSDLLVGLPSVLRQPWEGLDRA